MASGLIFGLGSCFPLSWITVVCTAVTVFVLPYAIRLSSRPVLHLYLFGVVFYVSAFYWLPYTISYFGGFSELFSYGLFLLFCLLSAIQLAIVGVLYKRLSCTMLKTWQLAFPLAWVVVEYAMPRMFPWALCHPLIQWSSFASLAEFVPVSLLSGLLLWWGSGFVRIVFARMENESLLSRAYFVIFILSLLLPVAGYIRNRGIMDIMEKSPSVILGIVQGNLEAKQKRDVRYLEANVQQYQKLSEQAAKRGAQILLWPESVSSTWIAEDLETVRHTASDPYPDNPLPVLYGGLMVRLRSVEAIERLVGKPISQVPSEEVRELMVERAFNSAIGIDTFGRIVGKYHKRVLMPFGEYLPGAQWLPFIKQLSPQTGSFDFGDIKGPIRFLLQQPSAEYASSIAIAPLICYEDLVTAPGLESQERGAELLVNLTNDAWYGNSSAPYQHHLIAAWRAIETRRFLVRVTNTGYSAIVDPFGQTLVGLPLFTEGLLLREVKALRVPSFKSQTRDWPAWLLCLIVGWFAIMAAKGKSQ